MQKLAFEDITALGTDLQDLDAELAGASSTTVPAPTTSGPWTPTRPPRPRLTALDRPDDVRHVTEIIDDGRYAIACVRARVAGEPLPTRRPPCFFDPRHGLSVEDVDWTPPGGTRARSRPARWTPSGSAPGPSRTPAR